MLPGDTDTGGSGGGFPHTRWADILKARSPDAHDGLDAFSLFARRYWKPVYSYAQKRGYDDEQAKDLTQAFFLWCLERGQLKRADPARGHFRAFVVTCLERFLVAQRRHVRAKRRYPTKGIIPMDELASGSERTYEPADELTPAAAFDRAWAVSLLESALEELSRQCREAGLQVHYYVFSKRIVEPILEGGRPVSLRSLSQGLGLTEQQVANRLETAKRAFRRVMRRLVSQCVSSEARITSELRAIQRILAAGERRPRPW